MSAIGLVALREYIEVFKPEVYFGQNPGFIGQGPCIDSWYNSARNFYCQLGRL